MVPNKLMRHNSAGTRARSKASEAVLDAKLKQKLKALGYLE